MNVDKQKIEDVGFIKTNEGFYLSYEKDLSSQDLTVEQLMKLLESVPSNLKVEFGMRYDKASSVEILITDDKFSFNPTE